MASTMPVLATSNAGKFRDSMPHIPAAGKVLARAVASAGTPSPRTVETFLPCWPQKPKALKSTIKMEKMKKVTEYTFFVFFLEKKKSGAVTTAGGGASSRWLLSWLQEGSG